jgi:flagellar motility protein MotE (MotC chaperone)
VKFILVPLLIIGMFVSFGAAVVAMLFFTKTVQTPQELKEFFTGRTDTVSVLDQYKQREDHLEELFQLAEQYKTRYEDQTRVAEVAQESLAVARMELRAREDTVLAEQRRLGIISDSTMQVQQTANLRDLAKFYAKIKPAVAAEILQKDGELSDTTVARLMKLLPTAQMAKIMSNMDPENAARITKLMLQLAP